SNLGEKMSEVLKEFVAPYVPLVSGPEGMKNLLSMGTIAWNCALTPEDERGEMLQSALNTLPPEFREEMKAILEQMIRRKEQHFAGNKRMILDYELTMTPSGPHLNVISSPPPGYKVDEEGSPALPTQ